MARKLNHHDASLEKKIIRFTKKAVEYLDSRPSLGIIYLKQALKIYNESNLPKRVYNERISKTITKYNNKIMHGQP